MTVSVKHISTGYTIIHENVAKIAETEERFELFDYRRPRYPISSTSYHNSLFTFMIV